MENETQLFTIEGGGCSYKAWAPRYYLAALEQSRAGTEDEVYGTLDGTVFQERSP